MSRISNCQKSYYSSSLNKHSKSRKKLEEVTDKLFTPDKPTILRYKQVPISTFYINSDDPSTSQSHTKPKTNIKTKNKKASKSKMKVQKSPNGKRLKAQKSPNGERPKAQTIDGWITKRQAEPKLSNKLHVPTFEEIVDYKKDVNNYKRRLDKLKFVGSEELINQSVENPDDEESKIDNKRYLNGSISKYGVYVPSFEDFVDYKKDLDNYKQCIENIDLEVSQESLEFDIEEPALSTVILDCKHLTKEQLQEACEQNYQYVCDIFNGKKDCIRHKRFQNKQNRDNFTYKDLKYNTSMITFTFEQKQVLLSFFYEKFNDGNIMFCQNTQYFFKVLLPELCTKIFMDTHNMDYEEATKYLDSRPT